MSLRTVAFLCGGIGDQLLHFSQLQALSTLNSTKIDIYCQHPEIMKTLDETGRTYDYSRAGYSSNAYLDRTRFYQSTEPLPINPDFFMDGGGTFA